MRIRDFLLAPSSQWRSRRFETTSIPPPPPPVQYDDVFAPVAQDDLLSPSERGFVEGASFDDPYQQQLWGLGLMNDDGTIDDDNAYIAQLLYDGWYDIEGLTLDQIAEIRNDFYFYSDFTPADIDWDAWREWYGDAA